MSDSDNVTPLTLNAASQARLLGREHVEENSEDLETYVQIEFFKDSRVPEITHNTASTERLLFAAEVIRQYALGHLAGTAK